ncbi:dockerin type I domain-containing protein [Ruminococcus sp.]|jgi:Ca2+-binding EF-hand superfamily protein|uniref:dockerin type I domain-containing protein n=1 Tax=Ruminococcus sp. TaxID=41978 RepID=UPI0025ED900C|nr:dockerin type I domain-containing protein [Ruminococcus sp.]
MKFRKIVTGIMASALMACSLSAVPANAAAAVNAEVAKSAQLVNDLDRMIKLRGTMPMKGDINGDKKVTTEDSAVLDVYLKGLININKNSTAFRVLDVNWDGKLDVKDQLLMPKKYNKAVLDFSYLHTGDFNSDGVVNSKDLTILKKNTNGIVLNPIIRIDDPIMVEPLIETEYDAVGRIIRKRPSIYDLNQDGYVNYKDINLLDSYISTFPLIRLY